MARNKKTKLNNDEIIDDMGIIEDDTDIQEMNNVDDNEPVIVEPPRKLTKEVKLGQYEIYQNLNNPNKFKTVEIGSTEHGEYKNNKDFKLIKKL